MRLNNGKNRTKKKLKTFNQPPNTGVPKNKQPSATNKPTISVCHATTSLSPFWATLLISSGVGGKDHKDEMDKQGLWTSDLPVPINRLVKGELIHRFVIWFPQDAVVRKRLWCWHWTSWLPAMGSFSFQRVARGGEVDLISTTADYEFNAPELIIHLFSVNVVFAITRSTNLLSMCRYIILSEPKQWLTSCKWTPLAGHKCSNQS